MQKRKEKENSAEQEMKQAKYKSEKSLCVYCGCVVIQSGEWYQVHTGNRSIFITAKHAQSSAGGCFRLGSCILLSAWKMETGVQSTGGAMHAPLLYIAVVIVVVVRSTIEFIVQSTCRHCSLLPCTPYLQKLGRKRDVPGIITVPIIAAIALSNKVPHAVLSRTLLSSL